MNIDPVAPTNIIEITLPSGRFARIRPPKFVDSLIADMISKGPKSAQLCEELSKRYEGEINAKDLYVVGLITRLVTIDDEPLGLLAALELDARESNAILNAMLPFMTGPMK
jgi:hypothetical protein